MTQSVATPDAPAAIGPYSQAVIHGGLGWCSGQIALNPTTGTLLEGTVQEETRLVLSNLQAVLRAAGSDLGHALKVTVYLKDMSDFAQVNEIYAEAFGEARPARACVQAAALPKDVRVEIDCVAAIA